MCASWVLLHLACRRVTQLPGQAVALTAQTLCAPVLLRRCLKDCTRQPLALTSRVSGAEMRQLCGGAASHKQRYECDNGGGARSYNFGDVLVESAINESGIEPDGSAWAFSSDMSSPTKGPGVCGCGEPLIWSLCARTSRDGPVRHDDDYAEDSTVHHCSACGECAAPNAQDHCTNPDCGKCFELPGPGTMNAACPHCGLGESQVRRMLRRRRAEVLLAAIDAGATVQAAAGRDDVPFDSADVQAYIKGLRAECAAPFDPDLEHGQPLYA